MIEYKQLPETRWKEYRDLRLESLEREPLAFGRAVEEEKDLSEEMWKQRLSSGIFALEQDRLVGMISVVFDTKIKTNHIANIYCFYVKKEYRGRSIGAGLMDAAINYIKTNPKIIKINLCVTVDQKPAVKLYKKINFEVIGRERKSLQVDGRFYDDLHMEKFLWSERKMVSFTTPIRAKYPDLGHFWY